MKPVEGYILEAAHFEAVNKNPCLKYVLVGITPGNKQTKKALKEAETLKLVPGTLEFKYHFAFKGSFMRKKLREMFEYKGLTDLVEQYEGNNNDSIFKYSKDSIIEFTSLIKDKATYISEGKTYLFNKPQEIDSDSSGVLQEAIGYPNCVGFKNGFKKDYEEVYSKRNVTFIACGKEVFKYLTNNMNIPKERVVAIVHPSFQASSHIKRFLEGKYNPEK